MVLLHAGRVALAVALLAPSCVWGGDATGAFAPYEDLTQVVADLTWHLDDDVYRFPPPRDPTGHDLFGLSLARLEAWEKRFPERQRDVTSYGRAEALEHLGEYTRASDLYRRVAGMTSPLAPVAAGGAARTQEFAAAAALPETAPRLDAELAALRTKLDAWEKLLGTYDGTPFAPLIQVEIERLEALGADVIVRHRTAIEDGDRTAERALRILIQRHADSKNLPRHVLALGDLYAEQTRDYLRAHERPLAFGPEEFNAHADRALDMYRKVATWDGVPEKPEGQARFNGFDAWKSRTLARYR